MQTVNKRFLRRGVIYATTATQFVLGFALVLFWWGFDRSASFALLGSVLIGIGVCNAACMFDYSLVAKANSLTRTSSRVESVLARLLLSLIAVVLVAMLLEAVFRISGIDSRSAFEKKFPVGVYRRAKPYVMFGGEPNGRLHGDEILNAAGYRGKLPSGKNSNAFRIFVLGGSTVFNEPPQYRTSWSKNSKPEGFLVRKCTTLAWSHLFREWSSLELSLR